MKLIYNDITGNFNYYDEYVSEFDIFTRATVAAGGSLNGTKAKKESTADKISGAIKSGTKAFNEATGIDPSR